MYNDNRNSQTLEYIHGMLEQLGGLARRQECDLLAYLIEMAAIEAGELARQERADPPVARVSGAGGKK
ncbi:hypothetical protein [Chelativorans sp. AA-79]|uniref:hypothetical protein n=1 Tax=Chelativorans sp. AA-79 TaxID=3028735 RepID=UPI0023F974FD|nr:hypothetical protein [Chelativorans sp. AA-79]WEX11716.1 hypothetical protein PVE73_12700 [Chelativorans sp. AA-79]